MWSSPKKFGEPWSIRIGKRVTDASTRMSRWELQDEPFAFCGRIGTAWVYLLNRVFSTHLIDFLLRATMQERKSALKKLRCCVCQDAQSSVFCTWAKIHCSRWRHSSTFGWYSRVMEVGTKGLIHGLVKLTKFCLLRETYGFVVTKWVLLKTAKLSVF